MSSELCWIEIDAGGPCRIFHTHSDAVASPAWDAGRCRQADYLLAVGIIRTRVFMRDDYECTHCGTPVTDASGHMHEREWRGRGGEISLENSTTLCNTCHMDDPVAGHGKRKVMWSNARKPNNF